MSLYNALFGTNSLAPALLRMLNLSVEDVPRFRDCYLAEGEDGTLEIHVYTRTGGGNRVDYADGNASLACHSHFLWDKDDDYDCTYATFAFSVPDRFVKLLTDIKQEIGIPDAPAKRFKRFASLMAKIKTGAPDDPEVQNAMEVAKPLVREIYKLMADGE